MSLCYSNGIGRINWVVALSILNFLLVIILYFTKDRDVINSLRKISYWSDSAPNHDQSVRNNKHLSIPEVMTNFRACIAPERVPETNRKWGTQFKEQLYECIKLHIPIQKHELDYFKGINVEHKHFLPMDKSYYADLSKNCFWLTAGIGNHTQAEQEFLKLNPKCKFFGIELAPSNVADFGTFGKVIQTGIGFDAQQSIMENYTDYAGNIYHNLTIKPFVTIVDQDIGSRLLHYAAIDIDGYEFPMVKEFIDDGHYYTNGIVICQMDIEWHAEVPGVVKDNFEFGTYMRQLFLNASSYLPVFAAPYSPGHEWAIKMTMINIKDTECELAFRFSKYFQR